MNLFTTKAADMICIGSKTTNPKHQMTFIPKDADSNGSEAAKAWAV